MKIRNGFVTNSSSSSFVLGFKNENSIAEELASDNIFAYFKRIYMDCMEAKKMTLEEVLECYEKDNKWNVRFDIECKSPKSRMMTWNEQCEWIKTKEYEDMCEKEMQRRVSTLKEKCKDKNVFVMIDYGDDCGDGDLEHRVVPGLNCCMTRISHH